MCRLPGLAESTVRCGSRAGVSRRPGRGSRPPLQPPPVTRSCGLIHPATGWVNVPGGAGESARECVATHWESSATAKGRAHCLKTVGSIITPVLSGSKSQNLHLFPGKSSLSSNGTGQGQLLKIMSLPASLSYHSATSRFWEGRT